MDKSDLAVELYDIIEKFGILYTLDAFIMAIGHVEDDSMNESEVEISMDIYPKLIKL